MSFTLSIVKVFIIKEINSNYNPEHSSPHLISILIVNDINITNVVYNINFG